LGEKAGLQCLDLSGLQYNPLFKTCSLGGSTAVNYLVHFRRSA
jgi:2-polyprenyl-3-methyl-5-hydroxy-6-metoxy-1,4-benzoquinol methylase